MTKPLGKIIRRIRTFIGENVLFLRLPYAYSRYYYRKHLGKELNYRHPSDFNEKLFWLARYWQDPRIIQCADKISVRQYVSSLGLERILPTVYAIYDSVDQIDFNVLPQSFVLKTNHGGGGKNMVFCKDKSSLDTVAAIKEIARGLNDIIGLDTCEYQYQYIQPKAYAEEYLGLGAEKLEIQFFCFNGRARHILVRNDLGDKANNSFAISYDLNWNRVADRRNEDMSINVPKPVVLDDMIHTANTLAAPFPQVRIDMILVGNNYYFGEMTFSTSGNILWNYPDETVRRWGDELTLPPKLKTKWRKLYKSYAK